MTDTRPVLIGMNNPHSDDPRYALFPLPRSSAGGRLFRLLVGRKPDVERGGYVRAFDRRNLLVGEWHKSKARWAAALLHDELRESGRTVLLFGAQVREAFGLPERLLHPTEIDGVRYRQLPHPSGRSLWYNDHTCRALVGMLLEELYEEQAQ